ncbi:MAG: hypothetical protein WCG90_08200 [Chitinophagia bacterium]
MIVTLDIPDYNFGDIVYLKTDTDQKPFMLIGVKLCVDGGPLLELQQGLVCSWHYLIEVSKEKNILIDQ